MWPEAMLGLDGMKNLSADIRHGQTPPRRLLVIVLFLAQDLPSDVCLFASALFENSATFGVQLLRGTSL
jgi:hypothetical protein